ncbi:MAG TPA: peptidylprolyl isomerase [Nocardioides sp.]|nr:peptidylprolyl isomerase [Nocardioides sp.]
MLKRALALPAVLLPLLATAACGNDTTASDPGASTATTGTTAASPATTGGKTCDFAVDGSQPAKGVTPPPSTPEYSGKVTATFDMSFGTMKATLDADKTPCTVESFASLVKQGYYDGSSCHREGNQPGFEFLQCGDPLFDPKHHNPQTDGTHGPGYTVPDELTGTETYPAGTLAMANTGAPNSGGGQFFICFGDSQFPPAYTVWGHLDAASLALLKKATKAGNDGAFAQAGGGYPNSPITFKSVKIG